jgi:hypothetical protein
MSYIGIFSPLELKMLLRQNVNINNSTWIKIVKNPVMKRGIYDYYSVQFWSSENEI